MAEEVVFVQPGRPGGRYFHMESGKYVNSYGQPLDESGELERLLEQKKHLDARISELEYHKELPKKEEAPTEHKERVKWVKDKGVEVPFGVSKEKLDSLVREIEDKKE